jgi:hypothetical protein
LYIRERYRKQTAWQEQHFISLKVLTECPFVFLVKAGGKEEN